LPNDIYIVTHISISNIKLFFTLIILFFFHQDQISLL